MRKGSAELTLLTPREQEVLGYLREELSNEQIAQHMGISIAGVKYHVSDIIMKLGVENRHDAARWTGDQRPWWQPAGALFSIPRPRLSWLSPAVAGSLAVAVVAGIGLLALLLFLQSDDGVGRIDVPVSITIPRTAVTDVQNFTFTTVMEGTVSQEEVVNGNVQQGTSVEFDLGLRFEGTFNAPDLVQGELELVGSGRDRPLIDLSRPGIGLGRPAIMEVLVSGDYAWWREPGGEWQPGIQPGDSLDPLVEFRLVGTPYFYLSSLQFDVLELPVRGVERVNGVDSYHVVLDRDALVQMLLPQGTGWTDTQSSDRIVPSTDFLDQVLPDDFNIEVWFATEELYPTRLLLEFSLREDERNKLIGLSGPGAVRLQFEITDPDVDAEIEPISTETSPR